MPPHAGQRTAFGREDLDQAAGYGQDEIVGREVEQRRGKFGVELVAVAGNAQHAGHRQGDAAALGLAFYQQAEILARELHGLFGRTGILVAERRDFRQVAGVHAALAHGEVDAAHAEIGDCQGHVEGGLPGLEIGRQGLHRRRGIGAGDVERESIGKQALGLMDGEGAGGQGFLVDAQAAESPGAELQGLHAELQDAFDEAVLDLQMLRAEERALGPDDRLQDAHVENKVSRRGVVRAIRA